MKSPFCLILATLSVCTVWGADSKLPADAAFVVRWTTTISHAPASVYSARAFAWANTYVAAAFEKLKSDANPQGFIAPYDGGYSIVLFADRRLSDEEKESLRKLILTQIDEAVKNDRRLPPDPKKG